MATPVSPAHREYVQWRARQIAYGRWNPWAGAGPGPGHVRLLRRAGASDRAIARAAGVSTMTVYRLRRGEPARGGPVPGRIRAAHAQQLLAVTTTRLRHAAVRRDAAGTRRRLQALIAVGHPAASLARSAGLPPRVVWGIVRGTTATVSRDMHDGVCVLYERAWDLRPLERTAAQRRAAAAARRRAASQGWPAPMGLDDDQIDDHAYRPRARWRPAGGASLPRSPDQPARTTDPRN